MRENRKTAREKRSGKQASRPTIGLLTYGSADPNNYSLWSGVADVAHERGANLICFPGSPLRSPYGFEAQANVLYDLVDAENVDALVIWSGVLAHHVDSKEVKVFCERYRPLPMVSVGLILEGIPSVRVNHCQGMREAMVHLVEVHGCRRVAFIRGAKGHPEAERYRAYTEVLAEYGLPLDLDLVAPGDFTKPGGAAAIALLLDQRKTNFEAVVAADDFMAIGALEALQARGIRVPDDVAVLGFDDTEESRYVTPPLTTVPLQMYEQGRQATEMLLAQLQGKEVPDEVSMPTELVVRQSCGCVVPAVVQAAVKVTATGETLEATFAARRERILSDMVQTVGAPSVGSAPGWAEQLLDAFSAELKGESPGDFLPALGEVLHRVVAEGGDVASWQGALSALRCHVLPCLDNDEALSRAENLWQQARVFIGETAQRVQAYRRLQAEQQAQILNEVSQALITAFDLEGLTDVLARELPPLGIERSYLSLYEDPEAPTEGSRLMLAYDDEGRVELEAGGQHFPSHQLVPVGLLPRDRRYSMVVEPLYFREEQLGFAIFEAGPREEKVCDTLRGQISSALKGALLVQQVESRALQLQTAAEVSRAASSILDPEKLLSQAVELIANRFDLYYVGLFLVDEAGKWAVLQAATGEAGRQMLEAGHKLEIGGDSMVGWCIANQQARIALRVGEEAVRFENPLLPETRSEMALPLISHGEAIGALTIQNSQEAAFSEEDIAVLQTMAGQLANAIENARLFERTRAALEETARAKESAEAANKALEGQIWHTTGQAQLGDKMRGEQDIPTLANNVVQQLCQYLKAQIGALYVTEDGTLNLVGSYAYASQKPARQFKFGEGLVGQAALEKQSLIVADVPEDCITTRSALGKIVPRHIMIFPFLYEDRVVGVVEMGALSEFTPAQMDFLQTAMTNIAIAFTTAQARARINELLAETQQQAEELQAQEEELRVANEELEAQTESLRVSEAELKEKQAVLDRQNRELKVAQQELEKKAAELALASKYKSEFLANMSHELRTPLNSLLILARMLADNEEGNLSEEQVESAQIIYSGGNDLLNLINDILDLSKVEAGRMTFNVEPMLLTDLVAAVRSQFAHVAEERGLELNIRLADDVPASIETDRQRVKQIVKNLLSNAFKFTSVGSVSLGIYRPDAGADLSRGGLDPSQAIAISVTDTGIGIAPEQQKVIFEAFQQADGSTNRQYGGTGLGLSISRELASKLGGQIDLTSELGKGSTFTLYLPLAGPAAESRQEPGAEGARPVSALQPRRAEPFEVYPERRARGEASLPSVQPLSSPAPASPSPPDDRADLKAGDKILLIIEDDPKFAKIVSDYAHEKGFKCLVAGDGQTGLELVKTYRAEAVILDLNLPDISGWEVLEVLKYDPNMRHIPVHIMSVGEETMDAYRKGAMGYLTKPVSREDLAESFQRIERFISREIKGLLVVEDDAKSRRSIKKLLGGRDVQISEAAGGQAALDLLKVQHFDCMILDLNLPDMTGFEVLSRMNEDEAIAKCPVIVYTGRDLSAEENLELMKYADRVIVKGVKSPERLLDETALFLHRVVADMPEAKQQTIKQLYNKEGLLEGKKVLIVDDDMRNSFALSKLLSDKGLIVKIAQNGQKALELLAENPDVDLVLMDIMMPVMDGYETIKRIRAQRELRALPILALTAKAMKGDREKCLAAGANDYLPKPVDIDRLFSMLRVWLYQ